jgi:hypothetical protein
MMYGPRVQFGDCLLERARPTYPIVSTAEMKVSHTDILVKTKRVIKLDLQNPPMRNGMKYHVRFFINWNVCREVVIAKSIMKMIAATKEGL